MIPIPSHVQALIFDLDGTLADTMPVHLVAWMEAAKAHDAPITEQMILDRTGMPTRRVAQQLNMDYGWSLDPDSVKAAKDEAYFRLKPQMGVKPITAVYEIAKSARGKMPMAIGTGSTHKSAMDTLTTLGVVDWFGAIITADDVTEHKPHPETYLKCAELLKVDPAVCVVFEDGAYGIQAAHAAGMHAIDVRPYV